MNWNEQGSKIRLRVQHIQQSSAPIKLNIHTYNTRVVPVTSYVAQLLPIPQDFLQLERAMLHTVLRLPQNALCHADFFHLDKIGGTACRSFTAASTAALIRTALKTVTGWKSWISQLHEAAQRFLPLEPLVRGLLTTSIWDSPPLAVNLREAALGLPNNPHWSVNISALLHSGLLPKQIQKCVYKDLVSSKFGNSLDETFCRRLTSLFHPYDLDFNNSILLQRCWDTLKMCRSAEVFKIIKCWCNGWATSTRYHEEVRLPCLFGCAHKSDDLQHYLQCPHLFALWSYLAHSVSSDPLIRWGLMHPNYKSLLQVACVFSGYHAVRRKFKDTHEFFHNNMTNISGSQVRISWTVFADAFQVDAREVSVYCRSFSVPSFLEYLDASNSDASCLNGTRRSTRLRSINDN